MPGTFVRGDSGLSVLSVAYGLPTKKESLALQRPQSHLRDASRTPSCNLGWDYHGQRGLL